MRTSNKICQSSTMTPPHARAPVCPPACKQHTCREKDVALLCLRAAAAQFASIN